jgi:hypothetical protein
MKLELVIAIIIGWFVLRTILRTIRKNKTNLQRGGEISNISGNPSQQIIDTTPQERDEASRTAEGRSLEQLLEEKNKRVIDPFLEATTLEDNAGNEYNEESLVEEYNRTHEQGKTVSHRKHHLFDEKKDRHKAHRHSPSSGKVKAQTDVQKRPERRVKKVHPIAAALQVKGGRKQAVIMAEILKRPEW